jgi:hypothetical protein
MTPLLDRPKSKCCFAHVDILSQLGETIFLADLENSSLPEPHDPPCLSTPRPMDEEPERWDGLS